MTASDVPEHIKLIITPISESKTFKASVFNEICLSFLKLMLCRGFWEHY